MFKNLMSRIKDDGNPRLHRIPFMVIWVAAYGLAWFSMFMLMIITSDMYDNAFMSWLNNDGQWLMAILSGTLFGGMLSLIQGWAMRRRYGFVPRFWRIVTIGGSAFAGLSMLQFSSFWSMDNAWGAGIAWFASIAILQAMVLFRVNHQSWLIALAGMAAGLIAASFEIFEIGSYNSIIWAVLVGAAIQAFGTGFVMLRLMATPREGIIPKRESDEKAKARSRDGLHPFSFISFWAAAYFMGWVTFFVSMALFYLTIAETAIMREVIYFLEMNAEWVFGMTIGAIIGFISALAQPWLMKQQSKTEVKHWIALSTIGWALAGIGLSHYMDAYYLSDFERTLALLVWFVTPAIFQTIPMWRAMRGGWLWIVTGIVTAIVAVSIESAFDWSGMAEFYAIMFGGIAQAIITGATFILLKSQQNQVEQQTDVVTA